jgi:von Willebrand factor type A domain
MRPWLLAVVAFAVLLVFPLFALPETSVKFDYIFLVDCSGSMEGLPPGSNNAVIFPKVKESIKDFIDDIGMDSTVVILSFHRGIQDWFMEDATDKGKIRLKKYVDGLKAQGQVTWIYYSLRDALKVAKDLRSKDKNGSKHSQMILLYTDGKDNGPQDLTLNGILDHFEVQRGENEFLFIKYITLGVDLEPKEREKLKNAAGVQVIENPKGELPRRFPVEVSPYVLDFGNMREREESTRTIVLKFDPQLKGKELSVRVDIPELSSKGVGYRIIPEKISIDNSISLRLAMFNRETLLSLPSKTYEGKLMLMGGDDLLISPQDLTLRCSLEPQKVVSVKPMEGTRLVKDFGMIRDAVQHPWPLLVTLNKSAKEREVRVEIRVEGVSEKGAAVESDILLLKTDKGETAKKVIVSSDSQIDLVLNLSKFPIKNGKYSGYVVFLADEGVKIEGDGLEANPRNPREYLAGFSFEVPSPPFPWIPLTAAIFAVAALAGFIAARPAFYKGAALEDSSNYLLSLKKKFLKGTYTVSSHKGDFVMPNLPSDVVFFIKPIRSSRNIRIRPAKNVALRDSAGNDISVAGVTLEPGNFIQTHDGNTPVRVYYKILGEEV